MCTGGFFCIYCRPPSHSTGDMQEVAVHKSRPCKVPWPLVRALIMTVGAIVILATTYDRCTGCVLGVMVFAGLTMNCVPGMPLVFVVAILVLLYHAIDYKKSSIKVEVPLQDIVYIPTWGDLKQYVKVGNKDVRSTD